MISGSFSSYRDTYYFHGVYSVSVGYENYLHTDLLLIWAFFGWNKDFVESDLISFDEYRLDLESNSLLRSTHLRFCVFKSSNWKDKL